MSEERLIIRLFHLAFPLVTTFIYLLTASFADVRTSIFQALFLD